MLIKIFFLFLLIFSCAAPIDYFGNQIDIDKDRIYLIRLNKNKIDRDRYTLIFAEQRGNPTVKSIKKRERTLNQYVELIMRYYGYTESEIINRKSRGVIEPRYFVEIKFK